VIILQKEFKTVLNSASEEYEEKRSKFISSVKPVQSEEEALEFINGLKTKYWDATHNVYSYYINGSNTIQRYSDDGEPSGTAGLPVLEVIKRKGVQNVAVVVTRYFGGTLLGAAGLIRAYSKSASLGIEAAEIVKRKLCAEVVLILEYTLFGRVQNLILANNYTIKDIAYAQDVEILVYVSVDDVEHFLKLVEEATNARAIVDIGKQAYITVCEDGRLIV
jgi:uncharacterized YigZ family protein